MFFKKSIMAAVALSFVSTIAFGATKKDIAPVETQDPYVLMELFGAAFSTIKEDYVEDADDKKLIEAAIDGMLTSLDPHSGFMNAESYEEMETQTKGEFGGLGMEVGMDNGFVRIMSPIDDTPAFKANLQTGDYITHIDGVSVVGLSLNDAVKKMRGKPNTKVNLTISRKDQDPFDVTLVRDIIRVKPVKYEAKGDIGYVRIITFSETTTDMVQKAVADLKNKIGSDKIKGFIIDVRNNPGGLLDQAVGVCDLFLNEGEIVSTRSRKAEDTMRFSATEGDIANGLPIVVMINEGSASASEIVSGALQDHRRGVVVGLKSFGKGSVQTIRAIPGFGGIRITTARYYTPSGKSIQAKGIEPDIVIPRAKIEELPVITGFGEGNLPSALSAEEGKKASETDKPKTTKVAPVKPKSNEGEKEEEKTDYQLDRALDILHAIALSQQR